MLFLKIDQEQNLPNPLLSSVTTRSNITDTICLTVAAAVVQIVASFMKYNLKHKTMAWQGSPKKNNKKKRSVTCDLGLKNKREIKDYIYIREEFISGHKKMITLLILSPEMNSTPMQAVKWWISFKYYCFRTSKERYFK